MLIALLKKLVVPVPIIAVIGAWLIRFERQRQGEYGKGSAAPAARRVGA